MSTQVTVSAEKLHDSFSDLFHIQAAAIELLKYKIRPDTAEHLLVMVAAELSGWAEQTDPAQQ